LVASLVFSPYTITVPRCGQDPSSHREERQASQQRNEAGLLHIVDLLGAMNYSYEVIYGMKTHRAHTRAYYLDHSSVK
jgi:hypothetical protein